MGALTSSRRKRGDDYFSCNYKTPVPISKKPKLVSQKIQNHPISTAIVRLFKYPAVVAPLRREIHAPCRISRTTAGADEMGNFLTLQHDRALRSAVKTLRYVKMDKKFVDIIDDDDVEVLETSPFVAKTVITEGSGQKGKKVVTEMMDNGDGVKKDVDNNFQLSTSSVVINNDDVEVLETSLFVAKTGISEGSGQKGKKVVIEILDNGNGVNKDVDNNFQLSTSSVVTDDVNLMMENAEKKLASTKFDDSSSLSDVHVYKKLWSSAEKRDDIIKRLQSQIEYNEKLLETHNLLRQQKKEHVKEVSGMEFCIYWRIQDFEAMVTEPFVPLTEEEETEVNRALSNPNRKRVLITHENSNIDITAEILQCLRPGAWLNDEVINVYVELLKEREKREPKKFLKCHFFNTFFYKKLIGLRGGYNYQSVRRWTSQRKLGYGLFDCDKIFVPIHKDIHWCLAVINKKDEKFQYLDSLGGTDSRVLNVLARYFTDEVKDKNGKDIDLSSWKKEFVEDLPEQLNGYDCGMFMLKYADFYSRDVGLCFNQEHMPYFRLRTAKEILRLRAD